MKSFSKFIMEAAPKKLVVRGKKVSDSTWEIVNNIVPDIKLEMWHNHFAGNDESGDYMPTGGARWSDSTPYEFKKFTDNRKDIDPNYDYSPLGKDINDGYLDWFKGENKYQVENMTKTMEHYIKAWLDFKGIPYEHDYNKFYLYYKGTNTVYKGAKSKGAKWMKEVSTTFLKSDPASKGKFEVISYEDAVKYKAINLDKLR